MVLLNNDYNKKFEDEILKKMGDATSSVKKELTPLLDERNKSESVIDHSVNLLNTDVINQSIIQDSINNNNQGQGNTNQKVRTIGARTNYPSYMKPSVSNESNHSDNNNQGFFQEDDQSIWRSGYTDTLILIGTGVLVLLVFVVSYLMLNYFG